MAVVIGKCPNPNPLIRCYTRIPVFYQVNLITTRHLNNIETKTNY